MGFEDFMVTECNEVFSDDEPIYCGIHTEMALE
jgi:hypothetical protein